MVLSKTILLLMAIEYCNLQVLERISPSTLTALESCALRVVLAKSLKPPPLTYPAASHLGNVIHKCINLIMAGTIESLETFEEKWKVFLEDEEKELKEGGFDFYIPLSEYAPGYAIKKLQVRSLLTKKTKHGQIAKERSKGTRILSEKWLESKDSKIGGKADLIVLSDLNNKISDYKTGKILQEEGDIKEDYSTQLKLYAYLFKETYDRYPDKLTIIDLEKNEYPVEFSPEECEELALRSKEMLFSINNNVKKGEFSKIANPDIHNCSRCLYRPACNFYWSLPIMETDSRFVDVRGTLKDLRQFRNGNINVTLEHNNNDLIVSHIEKGKFALLDNLRGKTISFYNVLQGDSNTYFKAIRSTKFFESNG